MSVPPSLTSPDSFRVLIGSISPTTSTTPVLYTLENRDSQSYRVFVWSRPPGPVMKRTPHASSGPLSDLSVPYLVRFIF